MADLYAVDTTELTGHASMLRTLADELTSALPTTTLTNGCYGQLGDDVVSALRAVAQTGLETLQGGASALESAAANVTVTASAYDNQETATSSGLSEIGGTLA